MVTRLALRATCSLLRATCAVFICAVVCPAQESTIGSWVQLQELTASDGAADGQFGNSIAVSGNVAVVGAVASNNRQGAAYVFVRSGGTWSQRAELTASDGAYVDTFGSSVAVDRSTIVVGSPCHLYHDNCGAGAAYVFVESDGIWSQQAELTASDGVDGDAFGWSVAVSGGRVVVGAPCGIYLDDTCQDAGQAYVFVESGGMWPQQAKLISSDGRGGFFGDQFGWSVAVSGSCVAVGSPQHAVGSNSSQGAAYMFVQSGTTWSQRAELIASDGAAYDFLGRSATVRGCTILAGAPFHAVGSNAVQGAAYVFGIPQHSAE